MKRRDLLLSFVTLPLASLGTARGQSTDKQFKPEELDQMLAPIALYPDALLAQTLMAATYPLEVVDAARWAKANPTLKGDAAVEAVKDKSWDVSVMSLAAFPQVLVQMSDHLDWMQKVGDAMLAQQPDVADSIQRLRAQAADAGNLKSGSEQKVTTQGLGADRTIAIEPANPQVVYVPVYDPNVTYGQWAYPAYPPTYYPPPPGYGYGSALVRGMMFGFGIAATSALFGGWNWGPRGGSYVNVNVNRAVNINRSYNVANVNNGAWRHDNVHRKGVAYRDANSRQQFGQNRPGVDQRQQYRGKIDAARPTGVQAANRPQANARPNLPQQRPGGQAPGAGAHRPQAPNNGGGAIGGVNRGQQVNHEAARGRAQQAKAAGHGGGGGGGARPAGGGGGGGAAARAGAARGGRQ